MHKSLLAAALALPLLASPAFAEVVAKVGDREITKAQVDAAIAEMGDRIKQVPEAQRGARALDAIIDTYVLADLARGEKLNENEEFKSRMELLEARNLQSLYFRDVISKSVTDEAVKARYDEEVAKLTPGQEVRARHILVKTEEEAKAVIEELKGGADFEELAKTKSTGPSGPRGGDLGFFGSGQMVPAFEKAAFALEPGGVTDTPVQTQFGYHIIKVEEKRDKPAPTLEAVAPQIRNALLRETYTELLRGEREKAGVEITQDSYKLPETQPQQ